MVVRGKSVKEVATKMKRPRATLGGKWNKFQESGILVIDDFLEQRSSLLVLLTVDEEDAVKLANDNKIMRCLSQCKKSHDGPLTTVEEIKMLVQNWSSTDKALHSALDLEIRFWKFSYTTVKVSCPLFKQRGLTVDQKVKNLTSFYKI